MMLWTASAYLLSPQQTALGNNGSSYLHDVCVYHIHSEQQPTRFGLPMQISTIVGGAISTDYGLRYQDF